MAKDLSSTVRDAVTHVARDAIKNLGDAKPSGSPIMRASRAGKSHASD